MIDVATLSVIRRWALRENLSIREIARRTGLSRNTIRKYLRSDDRAFAVFGGYDNMRTAVDRVSRGKLREVNARFSAMHLF
ncbi:hypothetical protein Ga0061062_103485 [Comamonas thiooxydans]|nr:putative transposase [Comamonas sp. E6]CUA93807.1 hypothetical protein Ga0061062_103485 [Comamonas thiooxydans]